MASAFGLPSERVWLNASHQGPLPDRAADAARQMVAWKQQPHHMSTPAPFTEIPARLRGVLAQLLGAHTDEVALANSSSYGLHLISNGLDLVAGDEVIVAANDFPSDVLPWLRLRETGVVVKQLEPTGKVLTAAEIATEITPATRVVCLTWVHSFSGHVVDLDAVGELCRRVGALLVVNGAQGIGAIPISPGSQPIDALVGVGFKYLCGPYGTGLLWLGPRAMDRVASSKLYWLSALTADDLAQEVLDLDGIEAPHNAARHDVFGTANFFNFAALTESAGLVLETGVDRIYAHNLALADMLVAGIDSTRFEVQPRGPIGRQSSILFARPLHRPLEEVGERLVAGGVDVARRRGMIRLAPHFYNTVDDIDRALDVINRV